MRVAKIVVLLLSAVFCSLLIDLPAILATKPLIFITSIKDEDATYDATNIIDYKAFESDKSYVITIKRGSLYYISYWIGNQAPWQTVLEAGAHAMEWHLRVRSKNCILREVEGRETNFFKALFENNDLIDTPTMERTSNEMDEHATKMILIKASRYYGSWLELIEFSSEYSKREDICFIAFNSKIVLLFCGSHVPDNDERMKAGMYLTRIVSRKMGPQVKIVKNMGIEGNAAFFYEFQQVSDAVERFKASSHYQKEEIMNYRMDVTNFYKSKSYYVAGVAERETMTEHSLSFMFSSESEEHPHFCYVFDTCLEEIGMLVWIGEYTDINIRRECAKSAEYNHHFFFRCPSTRPVTFINRENIYLSEREENLQVDELNFIEIMHQLHLSWTDVLVTK